MNITHGRKIFKHKRFLHFMVLNENESRKELCICNKHRCVWEKNVLHKNENRRHSQQSFRFSHTNISFIATWPSQGLEMDKLQEKINYYIGAKGEI